MVKTIKLLMVFALMMTFTFVLVHSTEERDRVLSWNFERSNFAYVENQLLKSSRFTQPETVDPVRYQTYKDDFTLSYTPEELEELGYLYIASSSTDETLMYFHPASFSVLIQLVETRYFWSSRAEFHFNEGTIPRNNELNSGIWIDYVLTNNVTLRQTDNALRARMTLTYDITPHGLEATVTFPSYGFSFDVSLTLEGRDLVAKIHADSINETLGMYRLLSIQLFPFLGSTRQDKVPGYVFLPDGIGALIRFDERYGTYYSSRFYGDDYGYRRSSIMRDSLSLPLYGIVHSVNENGLLTIIEQGDESAVLDAVLWGFNNSNYNRVSLRYVVREIYVNVIDKQGYGNETIPSDIKGTDFQVRYKFLVEEEANYVAMANIYKDHLLEQSILTLPSRDGDIPLSLDVIMQERESAFFGTRAVKMTSTSDVLAISEDLSNAGIENQMLTLHGWSTSGLAMSSPYKVDLNERDRNYTRMIASLEESGKAVYFMTDYVLSSNEADRIRYSMDVARRMSKLKMEITYYSLLNSRMDKYYYLYPEASLNYAKADLSRFERLNMQVAFDTLGYQLFSYYEGGSRYHRDTSIQYYQNILDLYGKSPIVRPNAYLLGHASHYLNVPLYNSQHDYFTDLVPFLPIVLSGSMDVFGPSLNFNALGKDQILALIDYNVYPSYVVTEEDTYKMRYTGSNQLFTTKFTDWSSRIISEYHYINDRLSLVKEARIIGREVIEPGVVIVSYDNDYRIFINYTETTKTVNGHTIPAKEAQVILHG